MFISRALGRVAQSTFRLQANPLATQAVASGKLERDSNSETPGCHGN